MTSWQAAEQCNFEPSLRFDALQSSLVFACSTVSNHILLQLVSSAMRVLVLQNEMQDFEKVRREQAQNMFLAVVALDGFPVCC